MNRKLKDKIINLRKQGKTYNEIQSILQCSKGLISYHLGPGQKRKSYLRASKWKRAAHPYVKKIERFTLQVQTNNQLFKSNNKWINLMKYKIKNFTKSQTKITVDDIINKVGENPKCYLTGEPIDIYKTTSYHFDHIIPASRGGTNTLDNLGICTRRANMAKGNMTLEEFYDFCQAVLNNKPKD